MAEFKPTSAEWQFEQRSALSARKIGPDNPPDNPYDVQIAHEEQLNQTFQLSASYA
jgi:hypothetical protein